MATRDDTLDVWRKLNTREHELLIQRTNTFLVWQSVLLAGYGWSHIRLIPFIGIISTAIWAQVAHRTKKMQEFYRSQVLLLEANLEEKDRVFTKGLDWRRNVKPPFLRITTSQYLVYAFPLIWTFVWMTIVIADLIARILSHSPK